MARLSPVPIRRLTHHRRQLNKLRYSGDRVTLIERVPCVACLFLESAIRITNEYGDNYVSLHSPTMMLCVC